MQYAFFSSSQWTANTIIQEEKQYDGVTDKLITGESISSLNIRFIATYLMFAFLNNFGNYCNPFRLSATYIAAR